jgi:hypothetical protein
MTWRETINAALREIELAKRVLDGLIERTKKL